MVRAVYTAFLAAGIVILAPVFLYRALRHKKYIGSLNERFGYPRVRPSDRPTLWIHAVSVGEVIAVESFVRAIAAEMYGWRVVLSTTTATGQQVARERFPELEVFYFPLDLPGPVSRTMSRVRPKALCLVETEIWPNVLAHCRRRRIPVAVVNGRLSDNSYRGYSRVRFLLRGVLANVSRFLMQTPTDAERIRSLGADASKVMVAGNMKYDVDREAFDSRTAATRQQLERAFGALDTRPLIVAGSTGPGEESVLLEALTLVRARTGCEDTRMLIAPRHPERFDEVAKLVAASGFRFVRRSGVPDAGESRNADVLLLDSIGELAAAYADASIVFVGGSLIPRGGHSILEPAMFARPIVVGPHTENFRKVVADFLDADAVLQLSNEQCNPHGVADVFSRLLLDENRRHQLGERALHVLETNRGATARTVAAARELFESGVQPS